MHNPAEHTPASGGQTIPAPAPLSFSEALRCSTSMTPSSAGVIVRLEGAQTENLKLFLDAGAVLTSQAGATIYLQFQGKPFIKDVFPLAAEPVSCPTCGLGVALSWIADHMVFGHQSTRDEIADIAAALEAGLLLETAAAAATPQTT